MKQSTEQASSPLPPKEIAQTAYQLWEKAGRPAGRNMEFWLKAERQCISTSGLLAEQKSVQTADQAHANQFFESLRSIKFAVISKPAVHALPSGQTPLDPRPTPTVQAAKSRRQKGGTASSRKVKHGK